VNNQTLDASADLFGFKLLDKAASTRTDNDQGLSAVSAKVGSVQLPIPTTTVVIAQQATVGAGDFITALANVIPSDPILGSPTGTVIFHLFGNSDADGTPLFTNTQALLSSGVGFTATATSAGFQTTTPGTNYWFADYVPVPNSTSFSPSSSSVPQAVTILPNPPTSVPAPLPIFGAAAAFGYSRKLRKRIIDSRNTVTTAPFD
jgi:hypothetical protein